MSIPDRRLLAGTLVGSSFHEDKPNRPWSVNNVIGVYVETAKCRKASLGDVIVGQGRNEPISPPNMAMEAATLASAPANVRLRSPGSD